MSESNRSGRLTAEAPPAPLTMPADVPASSGEVLAHRVDPPHDVPPPTGAASRVSPPAVSAESSDSPASASAAEAAAERFRREEELLLQASQIAQHLRGRFTELDRREQVLQTRLNELDQDQRKFRLWVGQVEEEFEDRNAKLCVREADVRQRIDTCEKLAAELQDERLELVRLRQVLDEERRTLRQQLAAQLEAEKDQLAREQAEWQQRRAGYEQEQAAHRHALQQERMLHEKRMRFQQAHLKQVQQQLEAGRRALRREQQLFRSRLQEEQMVSWQRRRQLEHCRWLLEQRENSWERERQLVARLYQAQAGELKRAWEEFHTQKVRWEEDSAAERLELRRQQELLASHAQSLNERQARLDRLRDELEQTHRESLELRLAVEEVWLELRQAAGREETEQRVAAVRQELAGSWQRQHAALERERRELGQMQAVLDAERRQLDDDRRQLADWLGRRAAELKQSEERLQQLAREVEGREEQWRRAHAGWIREKAEAERVIRGLLGQLTDSARAAEQAPVSTSATPGAAESAAPTDPAVDDVFLTLAGTAPAAEGSPP